MYAVYARQSIERQDSVSIDAQIEQCKKRINSEDIKIYSDVGYSGKNIKRPQFEQLLNDVKNGSIDAVVSYRLDRVSRNIIDFANLLTLFEKYNVKYISATEQFDTSIPMGRAMIYIVMVFAQLERETIAGRIADNYRYRAKLGGFMGGNTPLGYDSKKIEVDGKKISVLTENKDIVLLQKIFNMYVSGDNLYTIGKTINSLGFRTAKGKPWTATSINRVLRNISPCCADENIYNYLLSKGYEIVNAKEEFNGQYGMCLFFKNKNRHEATEIKEQIAVIGMHKPFISSELYIKAQIMLDKTKRKIAKRSQKSFLAGLLKCAECGYSFGLKSTEKGGKNYAYYYCRARNNMGLCNNNLYMPADELEEMVVDNCLKYLNTISESDIKNEKESSNNYLQIEELQKQIDNLILNIGKGNAVVDDLLTSKITAFQNQIEELKIESTKKYSKLNNKDIEGIKDKFQGFKTLDINEKTSLIRSVVKNVYIDNNGGITMQYIF